jgi:predicted DNA-binding protein
MYYNTSSKEKILTVRISKTLAEKIDNTAKKVGITRSELIKKGIEKALEEMEDKDTDEIKRATALMMQGKSVKLPPSVWKDIESKLKESVPIHHTLKEAMEFIRGREWQED